MAQADGTIQNDTGSNVRSDLNNNFAACFTNNSGSSAPSTTFAYMWWADTGNGLLKLRNGSNNAWITVGSLTDANLALATAASPTFTGNVTVPLGTVSLPGIRFSGDTDTGIYSSTDNTVNIATAGTLSHTFTSNYSTAAVPIRVPDGTAAAPSLTNNGDENTGIFFGSADEVSITTAGTERAQFDTNGLHVLQQKAVRYYDSDNSHYVAIRAASTVSANVTLTLPTSDGDADQFLKTDGSGNLSFATPPTGAFVPTGSVFCMAMTTAPSGYLECDGSAVSRTTYADLFAAIGTTWGSGNGSSTFNVPDLRGEFVRGWDNGRGVDTDRAFASAQGDQLQEHSHEIVVGQQNVGDPPNPITVRHFYIGGGPNEETETDGNTGNFGSETRPRNIAMMYVIKT